MRRGAVMLWIDVSWTAGKQNPLHSLNVLADDLRITCRRNHERQAASPEHRVQIVANLPDVFRLLVVSSRNSDPGFFHERTSARFHRELVLRTPKRTPHLTQ